MFLIGHQKHNFVIISNKTGLKPVSKECAKASFGNGACKKLYDMVNPTLNFHSLG